MRNGCVTCDVRSRLVEWTYSCGAKSRMQTSKAGVTGDESAGAMHLAILSQLSRLRAMPRRTTKMEVFGGGGLHSNEPSKISRTLP